MRTFFEFNSRPLMMIMKRKRNASIRVVSPCARLSHTTIVARQPTTRPPSHRQRTTSHPPALITNVTQPSIYCTGPLASCACLRPTARQPHAVARSCPSLPITYYLLLRPPAFQPAGFLLGSCTLYLLNYLLSTAAWLLVVDQRIWLINGTCF